jgi:hypothetical protein
MKPLWLLVALLCAAEPAAAGKLDDVRDEVRDSSSSSSDNDSRDSWRDYDDDDYYDHGDSDISPDLLLALFWPFMVPYAATDDCYGGDYVYAWYPYADNHPVALASTCADRVAREQAVGQSWAFQISADVVPQVDAILRLDASVRIQTPIRLELESGWSHFRERLPTGETDQLTIGDLNFVVRFAQSSTAQFRAGLGARVMVDAAGTDPGFNVTYGFDLFPVDPLVISAAVDLGMLGFAGYAQGRFTLGVTLLGGELYAGWDHIQIGGVSLTGPVAGARFWF